MNIKNMNIAGKLSWHQSSWNHKAVDLKPQRETGSVFIRPKEQRDDILKVDCFTRSCSSETALLELN